LPISAASTSACASSASAPAPTTSAAPSTPSARRWTTCNSPRRSGVDLLQDHLYPAELLYNVDSYIAELRHGAARQSGRAAPPGRPLLSLTAAPLPRESSVVRPDALPYPGCQWRLRPCAAWMS